MAEQQRHETAGISVDSNLTVIFKESIPLRCPDRSSMIAPSGSATNLDSLRAVEIPQYVTRIVHSDFQNCSSLGSVTIPDSVTHIGDNAFQNCSSLEIVTIPNSVTHIGDNVFPADCKLLHDSAWFGWLCHV